MLELDRWADALAALRPVRIDRERCLPLRSPRSTCHACAAICPEGAIDLGAVNVNACSTCGLCAAVCRADAILLDAPSDQELLQRFVALARRTGRLALTCSVGPGGEGGVRVGCLGRLTPELLLAAAACGFEQIDLNPGACVRCRHGAGMALWEEALQTAQRVLEGCSHPCRIRRTDGPEGRTGATRPAGVAVAAPVYEERRAFLLSVLGMLRAMLPLAPGPATAATEPEARPSRRREILRWAMAHLGTEGLELLPWGQAGLRLTGLCHACGVCERLCPSGAIRLEDRGLILSPQACHTCGLCTEACPSHALRLGAPRSLQALTEGGPERLGEPLAFRCSRCAREAEALGVAGAAPLCLPCSIRPPDREGSVT